MYFAKTADQLNLFHLRGSIFENMVINDFLKNAFNKGEKPKLSFYRDKTGREIDLIAETVNGLNLFEIKASTGYNPDYFKNIRYFEKTFPDKILSSSIIYDGPSSNINDLRSRILNFREAEIFNPDY